MVKILLFLLVIVVIFVHCNESSSRKNSSKTDSVAADSNVMHVQIPRSTCYRYIKGKDTVSLKVEKFPNVVTGMLTYALFGKDRNTGEIEGKMNGDTLVADYNFMSEATRSVRQVVFVIGDSTAIEFYGQEEKEKLTKGLTLSKVPCVD
jgi:hypothetical protein